MIALLQLHISKSSTNVPTKKASLDLKKKTKKKVSAGVFSLGPSNRHTGGGNEGGGHSGALLV